MMKTYYGYNYEEGRTMFATITGQMADGTFVYTEIAQREDGSVVLENGEPKLILNNQFRRRLKYGQQTFERI